MVSLNKVPNILAILESPYFGKLQNVSSRRYASQGPTMLMAGSSVGSDLGARLAICRNGFRGLGFRV